MEKNKIEELLEKINDSITKGKALINDLENQKSMLNSMLEVADVSKEEVKEEIVETNEEVIEENSKVVEETKEEKSLLSKLQDSTVKFSSVQRMLNINKMKATIIKNKFKNSFKKKEEPVETKEEVVEEITENIPNPAKEIMNKLGVGAKITGARAIGISRNKVTSLRTTFMAKISDVKTEVNDPNSISTMLDSILDTKQAKTI